MGPQLGEESEEKIGLERRTTKKNNFSDLDSINKNRKEIINYPIITSPIESGKMLA